jgi:hypothetical protein
MIKLLITAITWVTFSSGIFAVPNWLVSHETLTEAPKTTTDVYCNRGNWPDRERACERDSRPAIAAAKPQGVDTLIDMDRAQAYAAAPLATTGSVRFYDASREVMAPVEAPENAKSDASAGYALAGTTTVVPLPATRVAQLSQPVSYAADEIEPETKNLTQRSRRSFGDRAARIRPAHTSHRRVASASTPRRSAMLRIYGVAF